MNTPRAMRPLRRRTIRQHLRRLPLAGGVACVLALAGCGTTEIDPKKAVNAIHNSVAQAGNQLASASCPKGVKAKKGGTFTCTFRLTDGRHGIVTIVMVNDSGDIHIQPSAYHVQ